MWTDQYIDIPYKLNGRDYSGVDCWGLVRLIYKEQYNIDLPSYSEKYQNNDRELYQELISQYKESWALSANVEAGDVVLFKIMGTASHVGVAISSTEFIHIAHNSNVTIESLTSIKWSKRFIGSYKFNSNNDSINVSTAPYALNRQHFNVPVPPNTSISTLVDLICSEYAIRDELETRVNIFVNSLLIKQYNYNTTFIQPGDTVEFRVLPADNETFALVAMIGISIVAPYLATQALGYAAGVAGAAGATIGAGLGAMIYYGTMAAVQLIGAALVNSIFPVRPPSQPDQPASGESQAMTYGVRNQVRPYDPIPVILGKVRVTPPLGANTFLTFSGDGKDAYLTMMLLWGYGPLSIDRATLKVGDTPLDSYTVSAESTLDRIDDTAADFKAFDNIYSQDIQQEQINSELTCSAGITSTTITSGGGGYASPNTYSEVPLYKYRSSFLSVLGAVTSARATVTVNSSGIISNVVVTSSGEGFSVGQQLTIKSSDIGGYASEWSTDPESGQPVLVTVSEAAQPVITVTAVDTGVWAYSNISTSDKVTNVAVSLHFPQGLRKIATKGDSAGKSFGLSVGFDLQYSIDGGTSWVPFGPNSYSTSYPGYKDGFTKTFSIGLSLPGQSVQVRARRTTSDITEPNDDWRYSHTLVFLLATFTSANTKPVTDPLNCKLAKTALIIKSTKELNGSLEGLNAEVQTYTKSWNGSSWAYAPTSNPADLFLYVLQHPGNPDRILDTELNDRIDMPALQAWSEYCNSYTIPLEYNAVVASTRSVLEILRDICAAGRASPSFIDGKWTINIDTQKPYIVQHFSPHNSWGFEGTRTLPKLPDALKVSFYDETQGYSQVETIVFRPGKDINNSVLYESIALPGVTNPTLIKDHARWHMAQAQLRREVYTINTDIEYLVCNRGDRVKVTHYAPMWGLGSGRVKAIHSNSIFILDDLVRINPTKSYTIRFRNSNTAESVEKTLVTVFGIDTVNIDYKTVRITSSVALPFSLGDSVYVQSPATEATGTFIIEYISADRKTIGFSLSRGIPKYSTTGGSISMIDSYYKGVSVSEPILSNDVLVGDLFLFGELNTEAQDLLVTNIEALNNESARLTFIDYGVTDTYNIFTDYLTLTSDTVFETQITRPSTDLVNTFKPEHIPVIRAYMDLGSRVEISPGIYSYSLHVALANAFSSNSTLPTSVESIQIEYTLSNTEDTESINSIKVAYDAGNADITNILLYEEYKLRARYTSSDGKVGSWSDWIFFSTYPELLNTTTLTELKVYRRGKYLVVEPVVDIQDPQLKYFMIKVYQDLQDGTGDFWNSVDPTIRTYTSTSSINIDLTDFPSPRMDENGILYRVACRPVSINNALATESFLGSYSLSTLHPRDVI